LQSHSKYLAHRELESIVAGDNTIILIIIIIITIIFIFIFISLLFLLSLLLSHSKWQAGLVQAAIEVLQLLPNCGAFEIRISHKLLLDACLGQCEVPQELRQSALALLSTAAGASPMHPAARPKLWPSIKSVTCSINLGHCHEQCHLQAAVACLALVPSTLQPFSAQMSCYLAVM